VVSVRAGANAAQRARTTWTAEHPADREIRVVEWHRDLEKFGAAQVNARFVSRLRRQPTSDIWAGWMATKVAGEALVRHGAGREASLRTEALAGLSFDGHKGMPLRFDARSGHLVQPLYIQSAAGDLLGTVDPDEGIS
jgi:hypothetical protein